METPAGPLASVERDRLAVLEGELREARTLESDARMEIARFKSRLQLKEDECTLLAQRLDLATAPLPAHLTRGKAPVTDSAPPQQPPPAGGAGQAGKGGGEDAGEEVVSPAARSHLHAENASLKHEVEAARLLQEDTQRKLSAAQSELEHLQVQECSVALSPKPYTDTLHPKI